MSEEKRSPKILKAYQDGLAARLSGKPSNVPPKLSKDEKRSWRNGYRDGH